MKELWELFFTFLKIGSVSFGGGYAMLPILTREFVDKRAWATDTEFNDYFAIGQVTPGIIAANVATFIGNKRKGLIGGLVATIGLVTVPVIIITLIAALLTNFSDIAIVKHAFAGIRVAVCVLIVNALLRLWKKSVPDIAALVIFALLFTISAFGEYLPVPVDISPVILVIVAAIAGIVIQAVKQKGKAKEEDNK